MGWLLAGLFGLVLLGGLVVFIRERGRYRQPADDTLITELLGPRDVPAVPVPRVREGGEPSPGSRVREGGEPSPGSRVREGGEPSPGPSALPAREGDWLETQLAWISSWSQRMHQQIASAGRPKPDREE